MRRAVSRTLAPAVEVGGGGRSQARVKETKNGITKDREQQGGHSPQKSNNRRKKRGGEGKRAYLEAGTASALAVVETALGFGRCERRRGAPLACLWPWASFWPCSSTGASFSAPSSSVVACSRSSSVSASSFPPSSGRASFSALSLSPSPSWALPSPPSSPLSSSPLSSSSLSSSPAVFFVFFWRCWLPSCVGVVAQHFWPAQGFVMVVVALLVAVARDERRGGAMTDEGGSEG